MRSILTIGTVIPMSKGYTNVSKSKVNAPEFNEKFDPDAFFN